MSPDTLSGMEHFCAEQYYAFDADAWFARAASDGLRVAIAAEYLSMTSWYGHEEELESIASRVRAIVGPAARGGGSLAARGLGHFSARTRYLLAQRKK